MTCEQWQDWFGEAVEGALDVDRQAQVDAHCRSCAACRDLLNDLKDIRAAAATLDRLTPSPNLWRSIAARVELAAPESQPASLKPPVSAALPRGRGRLGWVQLAAAAALMMMLGSAVFLYRTSRQPAQDSSASDLVRSAASELQLAEQHYVNAITALEQLIVNRDTALDPSVAAEIAESLESIDRAIDNSRTALRSNPGSLVAQTSLLEALRMKVALLQETVSLMNARS